MANNPIYVETDELINGFPKSVRQGTVINDVDKTNSHYNNELNTVHIGSILSDAEEYIGQGVKYIAKLKNCTKTNNYGSIVPYGNNAFVETLTFPTGYNAPNSIIVKMDGEVADATEDYSYNKSYKTITINKFVLNGIENELEIIVEGVPTA